jgi:hypothetical protein
MQNRKEELTEFVKTIKEKVHDWWVSYDRKLWTGRIFVYGFLLLLVIFVGTILFTHFNLFHTDVNSARYMLSALVQSQAAIVAIVITLTLIAVQLTASAYSPRVIDIFKKNPDMWLLLGCYGISIFYGFIVLKLVVGAEGGVVSQSAIWSLGYVSISFEFCVSLAYWLGAFTFVALFPYMWNIIGLLKSENIIGRLAVEITKDKLLNSKEDPIQPIVAIIHGSLMKYDFVTTAVGLKIVTDQVIKSIDSDSGETISGSFCYYLTLIGRLAASREDVESTKEVFWNLRNFWESTAEKGLENPTQQAAWALGEIGKTAAEKGLENPTQQAAWALGDVGKTAAKKGLEGATRYAAWSLREVGRTTVKKGLESATKQVAESLGVVGKAAAGKKGLEDATRQAAESLAELTLLSEGIVKTAIHDYELKLKEQDLESFHKFRAIYREELWELEKTRAEK